MLRIAFAGTPGFAARALDALVAAGHDVALVLTRPDRPAGRGHSVQASEVKKLALALGLPVWQPASLRDDAARQRLAAIAPDVMVVAAYGLILPAAVLAIPRLGCVNIHASLLPRWRGAAPIQRAIEAGDTETGISIMQMDVGLDTGPVLKCSALPIRLDDTAGSLHDRLAGLGAALIVEALAGLEAGSLRPRPQAETGVTYARKIERADALLDFTQPAPVLVDRIRALDPAPGAQAMLGREPPVAIKLWRATVGQPSAFPVAAPGTVLAAGSSGLAIACGRGTLVALELQRPGGRRLACEDFLRGFPVAAGERFGLAEPTQPIPDGGAIHPAAAGQ